MGRNSRKLESRSSLPSDKLDFDHGGKGLFDMARGGGGEGAWPDNSAVFPSSRRVPRRWNIVPAGNRQVNPTPLYLQDLDRSRIEPNHPTSAKPLGACQRTISLSHSWMELAVLLSQCLGSRSTIPSCAGRCVKRRHHIIPVGIILRDIDLGCVPPSWPVCDDLTQVVAAELDTLV